MLLISWNRELSIGIPEMDEQHKRWINIINELHESLMNSLGTNALAKTFQDVIEYTAYHFDEEEKLMQQINYPDYLSHKAVHLSFTDKINKLRDEFMTGEVVLRTEIMGILKTWLTDHIMSMDKEYAGFQATK